MKEILKIFKNGDSSFGIEDTKFGIIVADEVESLASAESLAKRLLENYPGYQIKIEK